jgi:hypothetical protein
MYTMRLFGVKDLIGIYDDMKVEYAIGAKVDEIFLLYSNSEVSAVGA